MMITTLLNLPPHKRPLPVEQLESEKKPKVTPDAIGIPPDIVSRCQQEFDKIAENMQSRAVRQVGIEDATINSSLIHHYPTHFSNALNSNADITHQHDSQSCWIFAGLNVVELHVKKHLVPFKLSHSYVIFWSLFEKGNQFLANIINTDQESAKNIIRNGIEYGGNWQEFAFIAKKYGLVPEHLMPDSAVMSHFSPFESIYSDTLRAFGVELRTLIDDEEIHSRKNKMVMELYRILVVAFGKPPETVEWNQVEKYSPPSFLQNVIHYSFDNKVVIIHDPRKKRPYHTLYEVEKCPHKDRFLNLPIEKLLKYTSRSITEKKEAVWFSCNFNGVIDSRHGILHPQIFQTKELFGIDHPLGKRERLKYSVNLVDHAMIIKSVDISSTEEITAFEVENSWGDSSGNSGCLTMSPEWFAENVFEIVVDCSLLDPEDRQLLQTSPTHIPKSDVFA